MKPALEQYLLSTCLFIIDELNITYRDFDKNKLKKVADEDFNEMDITVKLGYPFRQLAHYTMGERGKNKAEKINHDLYIRSKGFKVEVKYLKNWETSYGTRSVSKTWKEYQTDFEWVFNEIDRGNKGNVAFVIGWFNCVNSFSKLMQLGAGCGSNPLVNESRLCYFPFLYKQNVPAHTIDLVYNYKMAYRELLINPTGHAKEEYNCMFLGNEEDCFHFVIYY